jgi:hypothetical protein
MEGLTVPAIPLPTEEQAVQFAVMVHAGLPPSEAILYFLSTEDPKVLAEATRKWQRSRPVARALQTLMSKPWTGMSLEERCRYALDQHYSQLAYLLYSTHYAEAAAGDKAKLDTARTALEAKLAGTAGKGDAMSQFWDDLRAGRISLKPKVLPAFGDA